jgi:hypothetical protein
VPNFVMTNSSCFDYVLRLRCGAVRRKGGQMQKFLKIRGARLIIVGVGAFFLGSATLSVGLAATGVIAACYNNISGIVRIATSSAPCVVAGNPILRHSPWLLETELAWNQVGSQGPTGAIGPTGATGATGPIGPSAAAGAQGAVGPSGAKGDAGGQGIQGPVGPSGTKGDTGSQGIPGPTGATGASGLGATVGSLDSLIGVSCNLGTSFAGTLQIFYTLPSQGSGITYKCVPASYKVSFSLVKQHELSADPPYCDVLTPCVPTYRNANGKITANAAGVDCASDCFYPSGTVVTLTATPSQVVEYPDQWSVFAGWGGACSGTATTCTLTITAAVTVEATFNLPPATP